MCYWWSLFPIGKWLHAGLEQICCKLYSQSLCQEAPDEEPPAGGGGGFAAGDFAGIRANAGNFARMKLNPSFRFSDEISTFMNMVSLSAARGKEIVDPMSFLNSVTRFKFDTDASGLEKIERHNVPHFLLMNMVARPMGMAALQPATMANFLKFFSLAGADVGEDEKKTETLDDRIKELEKKVAAQAKEINSLKLKTKKTPKTKK
jgi:hypothetical protein